MRMQLGTFVVQRIFALRRNFEHEGIVTALYSAQASYEQADGKTGLCLFREDWKPVSKSKKPAKVEAPSVWRDHNSHTCIVISAGKDVKYIAIDNDVLQVRTCTEKEFRGRRFVEPIEYPVKRAARLYVEFSRGLGATDEVLNALKKFTKLTKEEIEMSVAKRKAPAKKKAKAKSKSKAPAKPRGPSAASMFMDLLMEKGTGGECKHTDDQIFARVQKKFSLDDKKRSYVSWYRNKLKKDGNKPPNPKGGATAKGKAGRPKKKAAKKK